WSVALAVHAGVEHLRAHVARSLRDATKGQSPSGCVPAAAGSAGPALLYRSAPVERSRSGDMADAGTDIEERRAQVVRICAALPEVDVRDEQHIAFSVRKKRFAYCLDDHHGNGRVAINCKAPPGAQGELVAAEPRRYF